MKAAPAELERLLQETVSLPIPVNTAWVMHYINLILGAT